MCALQESIILNHPAMSWTNRSSLPSLTESNELRQTRKTWNEERSEFNRLKSLALAIGVEEVIVSPDSATPERRGLYIPDWAEDAELAREWGLPERKTRSLDRKSGTVILINYWSIVEQGACHTLAHEIGHHIYDLAEFTSHERSRPVTAVMRGFFPFDAYVHQDCDEICAESFAHYLTGAANKDVARHCESVLRRVPEEHRRKIRMFLSGV